MPVDRSRYPADWPETARRIKAAAGWRCQRCGKQCRRPGEPFDTHKRTLTVAHLDHDPENPHARLAAFCAPCHLRYDAPEKARRRREKARRNDSQMALFP
jgi:hypothetical protein